MTTQTATKSEQAHQNAEKKIQKVREDTSQIALIRKLCQGKRECFQIAPGG
jgi:hypothetical protein